MKRILALGAMALALGGCATVPADDYGYGYGYSPYYAPYAYDPYWGYYGYGFGYAPYYWGPPVILGGVFFRGFYHGHHFRGGGRQWSGGGNWGRGDWGGRHGGRRG